MIFIWGFSSYTKEEDTLSMRCPACYCNDLTKYSVRKWFTVFFIPLFPVSKKKIYLGCTECEAMYTIKSPESLNKHEQESTGCTRNYTAHE